VTATEAPVELAPPSSYCPTCARPRGNQHHADECVCAAAGVELAPTVHVLGGQRAALERAASGARSLGLLDVGCRSVIPLGAVNAALRELEVRGPKVPVRVTVERTNRGWRIEAQPGSGQLALEGMPHPFVATLPACDCDRTPCTRPGCREYGHCHGTTWGERHAEHVEAFVRKVAKTYPGRVTVGPIPR